MSCQNLGVWEVPTKPNGSKRYRKRQKRERNAVRTARDHNASGLRVLHTDYVQNVSATKIVIRVISNLLPTLFLHKRPKHSFMGVLSRREAGVPDDVGVATDTTRSFQNGFLFKPSGQQQVTRTSVDGSGGGEPPAAGAVEVGWHAVDERSLLPRLVLRAPRVAELGAETREEARLQSWLRLLQPGKGRKTVTTTWYRYLNCLEVMQPRWQGAQICATCCTFSRAPDINEDTFNQFGSVQLRNTNRGSDSNPTMSSNKFLPDTKCTSPFSPVSIFSPTEQLCR